MNAIISSFLSLALATAIFSIVPIVKALPLQQLSQPQVEWNINVRSSLRPQNSVFISPDDKWLYVTDRDGGLSKLDPTNGAYKAAYVPEKSKEQSVIYGDESGIAFYDGVEEGTDSFLVYWVYEPSFDGPVTRVIAVKHDPESTELEVLWTKNLKGILSGMPVIGSEGKFIYFTMNSPIGTVLASPPTMIPVAPPVETDAPVSSPPTISPVKAALNLPTISPVAAANVPTVSPVSGNLFEGGSDGNVEEPASNSTSETETLLKLPFFWAQITNEPKCTQDTNYPDEWLMLNETEREFYLFLDLESCCDTYPEACLPTRRLEKRFDRERELQLLSDGQDGESGKFIILSHPLNGALIYEFDSTSTLSIQKHDFAPVGIAHRPTFGNYNEGKDNSKDVIMWGSREGDDARSGETMLFQLPKDFSDFSGATPADTDDFQVRVMESVSWTTRTRPTFSNLGLDVYFATSDNSVTGWNRGRQFDIVANLGPVGLPPSTDGDGAFRPIVLANDDTTLLLGNTNNDILYNLEHVNGGIIWTLDNLGSTRITTPRISRDGDVAYFAKSNILQAINIADKTLLWGDNGFVHPSNDPSVPSTAAEFSLSSTGEYIYYCRSGASISGLRVAELVPTAAPIAPTSTPSSVPSLASSISPSVSAKPSTTIQPTVTLDPTHDPGYVPPSSSPTLTALPSAMPSVAHSGSPSTTPTATVSPSVSPSGLTLAPIDPTASSVAAGEGAPTLSPVVAQAIMTTSPTSNPSVAPSINSISAGNNPPTFTQPTFTPPSPNPPSAAAEVPDDTTETESSSSLSMAAIIGIAVGGGVGLILIIGMICYALKKKNGDDGVDMNWQAPNETSGGNTGAQEEGTTFQYGDEEHNAQSNAQSNQLRW